jgi:hypothetical protein
MIYYERLYKGRMVQGFGSNLDFHLLHPIFHFLLRAPIALNWPDGLFRTTYISYYGFQFELGN